MLKFDASQASQRLEDEVMAQEALEVDNDTRSEVGWAIVLLSGRQYALPIENLAQMVVLDELVKPATYPDHIRGIAMVRNKAVPVLDLRRRLGMTASDTERREFDALIQKRKQDHIEWLEELSRSIDEGRPFELTTDPHQCAFGQWYDTYETDNTQLAFHLKKFDAPHQRIHAVAKRAAALLEAGQVAQAQSLVKQTRDTELAELIGLFDEVADILRASREVVLVMVLDGELCGFLVDEVQAVRSIEAEHIQPINNVLASQNGLTTGIADVGGVMTLLLDARQLMCSPARSD